MSAHRKGRGTAKGRAQRKPPPHRTSNGNPFAGYGVVTCSAVPVSLGIRPAGDHRSSRGLPAGCTDRRTLSGARGRATFFGRRSPPFPPHPTVCRMTYPSTFRTTVHGTVFGSRSTHLENLNAGDRLVLIPDPPGNAEPAVWVHLPTGDPVGHLPPEINAWLAPLMLGGGSASATAVRVGGRNVPSWRRLLIEVECRGRLMPT